MDAQTDSNMSQNKMWAADRSKDARIANTACSFWLAIAATLVFGYLITTPNTNAQSPCSGGNKLQDPGFEASSDNGGDITNPAWNSSSTVFGTSLCNTASCGDGGGTAGPRNGNYWVWFGGTDGPETGTLSQIVAIPPGATATLKYYLRIGGVTAPFTDVFRVVVDGTTVQTVPEPNVAEANYQLRQVNLNAYADGQGHTISLQYDSPSGGGTANFNVDDVTLEIACSPATSPPLAQLANISTRLVVGTGGDALIGGFIITGTHSKKIIVRAIGPSLSALGVPGVLGDPALELHDGTGALIASNDDWQVTQVGGIVTASQVAEIQNSGVSPTAAAESAIIASLAPGAYTAIVRGKNSTTGVGLVEAYDLDRTVDSKLANISTRGFVQTGDNVMIGGVIIVGNGPASVVVRAIGPSLAQAGVPNSLPATTLELHDSNGAVIGLSDNWTESDHSTWTQAVGLAPSSNSESAIFQTLLPGQYTAIVRGRNNTSGVGLVETYDITPLTFGEASQISSSQGGKIAIPSVASVTFPAGALPSGLAIDMVALSSQSTAADFTTVAPIYSATSKLPYDVRINTGMTAPTAAIQISFVVPASYVNSLPAGAGLQAFVQLVQNSAEEILDNFDVCPSSFDGATNTLVATLPAEAFTSSRSQNGTFEAVVTIGAISEATTAAAQSAHPLSRSITFGPVAAAGCELNPIGSPLDQLTIKETFNPPGSSSGRVHQGIDARAATGDAVHAVADGKVLINTVQTCNEQGGCHRCITTQSGIKCKDVSKGDAWGWGRFVVIQHDDRSLSLYAHLDDGSTTALKPGMPVQRGAVIAAADNSGTSFGSHLHFEYILPLFPDEPINRFTLRTDPQSCITPSATPTPTVTPTPTPGALTGTWVGTWTWSGPGANGCQFNDGGSFSMTLTQSGNSFSGSTTGAGVETRDDDTCAVTSVETSTGTISGTASGTSLNLSFNLQGSVNTLNFTGTGTLNGNTITASFVRDTGGVGSFSVSRQ
jgi:murein DD-endopeptidase MepM/ murein hydrolase activator NlpD